MITVRRSNERGRGEHGWLHSRHTFSFAGYFDPQHMGYRALRVINDDVVEGGEGFGKHGHRDMEIVSYVVEGALSHRDSMGNEATLRPGDVQAMTAGRGIQHSEYNGSKTDPSHFLQIWIMPDAEGTTPRYADRSFGDQLDKGGLTLIASPDGSNGSLPIGADARVYAARPKKGTRHEFALGPGRGAWIQVVRGNLTVNGTALEPGDGVSIEDEPKVEIAAGTDAEYLAFDLA